MKHTPAPLSGFAGCGRRRYYAVYTLLFAILAAAVFSWHLLAGKTLIWQVDGWSQHFKALAYYGRYLRGIARNLLAGRGLVIPEWDFAIGEGSDILQALHYYVIGDPLALFSALVPTRQLHVFYTLASVARMYLAGAAFSELAFGTGLKNRYGALAGALSYAFCYWAIRAAVRHPYFANPLIYFPLIVLGIEKILRGERPYLFIIFVAVAGVSNFYFFYIIALLAALYALIRLGFAFGRNVRAALAALARLALFAVVGACIAGAVLAPIVFIFLSDSRLAIAQPFHWLYPLSYYSAMPSTALSGGDTFWLLMGLSAPVLIGLFAMVTARGHRLLKALLIACAAIAAFPILGRLFNGMAYMTNRWSWALALLGAYTLAAKWDEMLAMRAREWLRVLVCCVAFYAMCMLFDRSRDMAALAAVPLLLIALLVARDGADNPLKPAARQAALVLLVGVSAFMVAFWHFAPEGGDEISTMIDRTQAQGALFDNEAAAVARVADEAYPRYSGAVINANANMIGGVSSTQYRWSISNGCVNDFRAQLETRDYNYVLTDYDDRAALTALAAVGYYVADGETKVPYGFSKLESLEGFDIYKNDHALPLGYCYGEYLTREAWDAMDAVQKQQAMLEAAVVDGDPDGLAAHAGDVPDYSVPFTVTCGKDVVQTESGFVTTAKNAKVTLTFEGVTRAETCLRLGGVAFTATPEYDLYFGGEDVDPSNLYGREQWDALTYEQRHSIRKARRYWNGVVDPEFTVTGSNGVTKIAKYKQPDAAFTAGRTDFIVNLGYQKKPLTSITLKLSSRGVYTFDDLRVYCVPVKGYAKKIDALKADALEDVKLGVNAIDGRLSLDETKLLCVAVPWSAGWRATIDGRDAPVLLANDHYLGLLVPAGEHAIAFRYHRPYQKAGFLLTAAGLAALIALIALTERKRKAQHK